MFPVSKTFLDAIRAGSYQFVAVADVFFNGVFAVSLPIESGSVEVDRTATIRRSCNITVADQKFVPTYVNSPLAPYGAEIRIRAGIQYLNTTQELCSLGTFRVQEVTWDEAGGSLPSVIGLDRSKTLEDAKFLVPRDLSGQGAQSAIQALVSEVGSWSVLFDTSLSDVTIPGGSVFDSERLTTVQNLCSALGADGYFDVYGNFVVQATPGLKHTNTSGDAVWTIDAGPTGVLVSAGRGVSRSGVYNAVAIQGTSTATAAPMGYAADTDSRSPTYWGPATALPFGPFVTTPFGQVVLRETNSLLTTAQQCTVAAQARLNDVLGLARSLDFKTLVNPALQEGDIINVVYLDGTSELHLVDKLHIPLGQGEFTGSTRTLTYQFSAGT